MLRKWIILTMLLLLPIMARAQFINSVVATPASNTLTITWQTAAPATCHILYGLTKTLTLRWPASGNTTCGTATLTGLNSTSLYYFKITAVDSLKESVSSILYTSTTTAHSVSLTWQEASAYAGFNVFRSTIQGGPYDQINTSLVPATAYEDQNVALATTYYYVVTAVDSAGNQSSNSNETSATIPGQ